jgi:hypothetical protein
MRCQTIRFAKVSRCRLCQELGRYKVPIRASILRHLQKQDSPIFIGLMIHRLALRNYNNHSIPKRKIVWRARARPSRCPLSPELRPD